jgi:hypothetical protein
VPVSTPSNPQPDYEFDFSPNPQGQPPQRKKTRVEEDTTPLEDLAEEVADGIFGRINPGGCLLGPLWWLIKLPFRFVRWVLNEVFD